MQGEERGISVGTGALIVAVVVVAVCGGSYLVTQLQSSAPGSNATPATLDILVWNDSRTRTVKFSVFVDGNRVWENDLTQDPTRIPSGFESFEIGVEKGKHTIKAVVQNGETKTGKWKIEIPDENYWIAVMYTVENTIFFHKSDDKPIRPC